MYLVKFICSSGNQHSVAVSGEDTLFNMCWIMDTSESVRAWKILDHSPEDMGWAEGKNWNKWVPHFTTDQAEAYADARVREALEEAAQIADGFDHFATCDAIRALTPKKAKS